MVWWWGAKCKCSCCRGERKTWPLALRGPRRPRPLPSKEAKPQNAKQRGGGTAAAGAPQPSPAALTGSSWRSRPGSAGLWEPRTSHACWNPQVGVGCMGLNYTTWFNKKCIKIIKMETHGYYLSSVCLATPCYFTYRSSGNISKTH